MPANSPEEVNGALVNALNAADMDALLELYEPDAALVPEPGQVLAGTDQVRAGLEQFLALQGELTSDVKHVVQAGDIALLVAEWSLAGSDEEGNAVQLQSSSIEVARRQSDGTWRYVIDAPFGRPLLT